MKLLIVSEDISCESDELLNHINSNFPDIELVEINNENQIKEDPILEAWNSIVLYRFKSDSITVSNEKIIKAFKDKTHSKGIILPVSYSTSAKPPGILSPVKANKLSDANAVNIISKRLASYFGLLCLGKDHTVFISYRATDGKEYAKEINSILQSRGFNTFLDEAKDIDGEGAIPIGMQAQDFIDNHLEKCSALILVDTPDVTQSDYVLHEIEVANSLLIPVLPLCFSSDGSHTSPRLISLSSLKRFVSMGTSVDEDQMMDALSDFLNDIYCRKKRVAIGVAKTFKDAGYSWDNVDERRLYFSSQKQKKITLKSILSHCPIHQGIFPPYISTFSKFNGIVDKHFNSRFLIYDGELLNRKELNQLKSQIGAHNVEILHHQEIKTALEE